MCKNKLLRGNKMIIIKPIVSIILLIPYILFFGAFSLGVDFPDNTSIYYNGWLI